MPITDIFGLIKPQLSAYRTNMGHEISFLTMSNLRNIYQYKSIFVCYHVLYFPSGKVPGPWNWHQTLPSLGAKTSHSQTDGSLVAAVLYGSASNICCTTLKSHQVTSPSCRKYIKFTTCFLVYICARAVR